MGKAPTAGQMVALSQHALRAQPGMPLTKRMFRRADEEGGKMSGFIVEDCPACDGYGVTAHRVTVYEHGCGFPHSDTDERPCERCGGAGYIEDDVEPITLEDLGR
jgi:hypothetical protein